MFYLTKEDEIQTSITEFAPRKILWLDTEVADWDTPYPRLSLIQVLADAKAATLCQDGHCLSGSGAFSFK